MGVVIGIWSLLKTPPYLSTWTFSHPIRRAITTFFTAPNSLYMLGSPQPGVLDGLSALPTSFRCCFLRRHLFHFRARFPSSKNLQGSHSGSLSNYGG